MSDKPPALDLHAILNALGFSRFLDNKRSKEYPSYGIKITVNFESETIIYPEEIKLGDRTTSNFQNSENFVVLECVDRLLTKGYPPSCIELEHKWSVGRRHKGKLDILVRNNTSNQSYLMIECKTHPEEYEKEKKRMQERDGGQLFSYWLQDRNADYLCLYTSYVSQGNVKYESAIVKIESEFRPLGDVKEVFNRWNKQIAYKGLFESDVNPYGVGRKPLLRRDLKVLQKEDGNRIYLQFLEILRHNVVSDKGNAFNKIFNLFLCKIVDEDKLPQEQLDFQWLEGVDTSMTLLGRLNTLYKLGMARYLNKDVTDYSVEDIVESNGLTEEARRKIEELRLFKNQEFAFCEVFNKESFEQNAKVVIEMIRLLEHWQLRYTHKQQFLGEFFELLLNTGFKQESGQFFTPVPLVRFILMSLPIKEIVIEKIRSGEQDFLPYTIDFACGSGHFLTEVMDVLNDIIQELPDHQLNQSQRRKLGGFREDTFGWAKEFVYGIEFDYRLAKTSKLACFLNGDGEAQIIHGSGIAPFTSDTYRNRLRTNSTENCTFDVLIANPPYAVKGFKSVVQNGSQSFTLFEDLPDNSKKIEILFIERMIQLLKPEGIAGIILPRSILEGSEPVYEKTRELLLSYFEIKGIVCLGKNAFMETDIKTIVLFLRKRKIRLKLETKADYAVLQNDEPVVVVSSGVKKTEKQFLGYKFSKRRGHEGINILDTNKVLDLNNPYSKNHVNSYILANMTGEKHQTSVDPSLSDHLTVRSMKSMFSRIDSDEFSNKFVFSHGIPWQTDNRISYEQLETIASLKNGSIITEETAEPGSIPVIAGGAGSSPYYHNVANEEKDVITVSKSGINAGYVWWHEEPIWASDCVIVRSKDESTYLTRFIYICMFKRQAEIYKKQEGIGQEHVYTRHLKDMPIPALSLEEQRRVVHTFDEIGIKERELKLSVENLESEALGNL